MTELTKTDKLSIQPNPLMTISIEHSEPVMLEAFVHWQGYKWSVKKTHGASGASESEIQKLQTQWQKFINALPKKEIFEAAHRTEKNAAVQSEEITKFKVITDQNCLYTVTETSENFERQTPISSQVEPRLQTLLTLIDKPFLSASLLEKMEKKPPKSPLSAQVSAQAATPSSSVVPPPTLRNPTNWCFFNTALWTLLSFGDEIEQFDESVLKEGPDLSLAQAIKTFVRQSKRGENVAKTVDQILNLLIQAGKIEVHWLWRHVEQGDYEKILSHMLSVFAKDPNTQILIQAHKSHTKMLGDDPPANSSEDPTLPLIYGFWEPGRTVQEALDASLHFQTARDLTTSREKTERIFTTQIEYLTTSKSHPKTVVLRGPRDLGPVNTQGHESIQMQGTTYDLARVVIHRGTLKGGHYFALERSVHPVTNKPIYWLCDDKKSPIVKRISQKTYMEFVNTAQYPVFTYTKRSSN